MAVKVINKKEQYAFCGLDTHEYFMFEGEAKCPICDIKLEIDDTYDMEYDSETMVLCQVGHCPRCDRNYQWDECYDLTNKSINGLSEV